MVLFKYFTFILLIISVTSCRSVAKFPVSDVVPGAEITATKKQDKFNNFVIELTAKNLAEANRLNPQMSNYSVWIVVDNGTIKNIGQLNTKNSGKAVLKTVTPHNVREIFVTAENQGNLSYPSGVVISRTTFSK